MSSVWRTWYNLTQTDHHVRTVPWHKLHYVRPWCLVLSKHCWLRSCLFRYTCFFRRETSKICYFNTVVNNGLRESYLLQTNSSFPLRLSELQGMFNLGQIYQTKNRTRNLKASLPSSSTRALFSDKARCFSQSECTLYGNFIIIIYHWGVFYFAQEVNLEILSY